MINRRDFMKTGSVLAVSTLGIPLKSTIAMAKTPGKTAVSETMMSPDTLDLTDNGRLAINGLLGSLDPKIDYECCFVNFFSVHPAYMVHWSTMVSGVMPKYMEALPLLRQMTGSDYGMDLEKGYMDAMLKNASEDGLIYDRATPNRPWNVGVVYGKKDWNEDYANMAGNGRYLTGLTYCYQATKDDVWKKRAKKTAERMLELAITEGDHAWYPNPGLGNDFSYPRVSGWTTKKAPEKASEGFEGATLFYLFQPLRGLTRWYALSGDERFKDLAGKFVNFGLQKKFWGHSQEANPSAGAERGHFHGHLHGTLAALRGVLDYAIVANDSTVKHFVHNAYGWVRQKGIHRLGVFPQAEDLTEGCVLGDMIGLAVALTDAGLGDYWDDVEMYARNGLVSVQATDLDEMTRVSNEGKHRPKGSQWGAQRDGRFGANNKGELPGQEIFDDVLKRSVGGFSYIAGATHIEPRVMHCCTANGSQGLYYAWEGILRCQGDTAQINMWLNRRSPLVDVLSHLPYQGRLIVKNKGAKKIFIRKPGWARQSLMRCRVNGNDVQPVWIGNRMMFTSLRGNEDITIETPVDVSRGEYTLLEVNDTKGSKGRFICEFKGHTAISVERIGEMPEIQRNWYKIFQREHMRADKTPMKPTVKYVPPKKLIQWSVL